MSKDASLSFACLGGTRLVGIQSAEGARDAAAQVFTVDCRGKGLEQDEDVQGWQAPAHTAKGFADQPFELVATGGFACHPLADGETESGPADGIVAVVDDEPRVVVTVADFEKRREVRRGAQALLGSKSSRRRVSVGTAGGGYQLGVNRSRPRARRALRTRRPPLVFIRARKPWLRTRLSRLG